MGGWRGQRVAVASLVVASALVLLGASGCSRSRVPDPVSFEPERSAPAEANTRAAEFVPTSGYRTFLVSVPGKDVRTGDLVVRLAEIGNGPIDNIVNGPKVDPSEWTTRLSLRITVRNVGSVPATVTVSQDYPIVHDGKGHHRPPIQGAHDVITQGLAKPPVSDAGPVSAPRKLEPGRELVTLSSFVVRKDDRTRTLWVAYPLNPTTLVRFKLEPSKPPLF